MCVPHRLPILNRLRQSTLIADRVVPFGQLVVEPPFGIPWGVFDRRREFYILGQVSELSAGGDQD